MQEAQPVDPTRVESPTTQAFPAASSISPFAKHLPSIFPPYMCKSIIKSELRAEVEIRSAASPESSFLKVAIYPSKVPYLAKELFGVDIDFEDGRMFLRFDNGASAQIDALKLTGAKHECLEKCLGRELTTAVRSSCTYSKELARGEPLTDCVSLTVHGDTGIPCFLTFLSDPNSFSTIVAQLWRPG